LHPRCLFTMYDLTRWVHSLAHVRRLFDVVNDLKQHRMYLIFEYLDGDLYRLMQVALLY